MKHYASGIVALAILVAGCSSTPSKNANEAQSSAAVAAGTLAEQSKLSVDWVSEGLKVFTTTDGKFEKLEVSGTAEVWKGDSDVLNLLAEADAMARLVAYKDGTTITRQTRITLLAKAIQQTKSKAAESRNSAKEDINEIDSRQLSADTDSLSTDSNTSQNTGPTSSVTAEDLRAAQAANSTMVATITNMQSQGRLVGVHKVAGRISSDGKIYIATYEWSERSQANAEHVRNRMTGKTSKNK